MELRRFVICSTTCILGALAFVPVTGCAAEEDGDEASATTTSALQAQSQAGLTAGIADVEGTVAPSAEDAAKAVADGPLDNLQPAGCAKKTRDGNVVTLALDACTGPFGKVAITGTLTATFSNPSADTVHVDIEAADGTTANGSPLSYAATGDVRFDGSQRFVTYHGSSNGTTKRGKSFVRTTDLSIVADVTTHCATMAGTSKGSIGRYEVDLEVTGFKGCRDACPTAGTAHATVNGPLVNDASVDVTFDGSKSAHVKVSARKTRTLDVAMDCSAAEAAE